jgi:hypothetical protein
VSDPRGPLHFGHGAGCCPPRVDVHSLRSRTRLANPRERPAAQPGSHGVRHDRGTAPLASILGGRGGYLGTVGDVILITLLQSILSVIQMPDAGRQFIYGVVIVAMLLLYGRESSAR